MKSLKIAVIFDFDDTLCPDSTDGFLKSVGVQTEHFWSTCNKMIENGYDPVLAFMNHMIIYSKKKEFKEKFRLDSLSQYGKCISFFPGVSRLFSDLNSFTRNQAPHVELVFYVISSGIETIIRSTSLSKEFRAIFSSDFVYHPKNKKIIFPKRVVSFTDKTRFLFAISKGISAEEYFKNPFSVNSKVKSREYEVPFSRMIYIGDGYSDIPCFVLLKAYGGYGIGVYKKSRFSVARLLVDDERVSSIAQIDDPTGEMLQSQIKVYIKEILEKDF